MGEVAEEAEEKGGVGARGGERGGECGEGDGLGVVVDCVEDFEFYCAFEGECVGDGEDFVPDLGL